SLRGQLGNVDEALDAFLDLHEYPEIRHRADLAVDPRVQRVALRDRVPWIGAELLDPEADPFIFRIDSAPDRLDLVALLHHFRRRAYVLCSRQIGNMQHAVDALLDLDERAEVRDRLDLAFDVSADRMLLGQRDPRARFSLFEAQGDPPVRLLDPQHLH